MASVASGRDATACNNGVDDDGDGLVDGFDPECTGALDGDEASYATGMPGDNRDPKWQDCFFDGNSGAGDDGCRYSTDCLTGKPPTSDKNCQVSTACVNFCGRLTPNGCDCFGCCRVQLPSGDSLDILTGKGCSLDSASDAEACSVPKKSTQCENECGTCELCAGKTLADLPASCARSDPPPGEPTPPPANTCDSGETVCGADLPACGAGEYCSFGAASSPFAESSGKAAGRDPGARFSQVVVSV